VDKYLWCFEGQA